MKHFAVLSTNPSDEDAMRCKVVALIKADNIDDALSTIQSSQKFTFDFSYLKVFNVVIFSFCFLFICLNYICVPLWIKESWLVSKKFV